MAVTSAQTKVMVIPEAKKVEVSETVINCPAPAATPADITKTTGGNSTVDIKESTARVARIVREDAAEAMEEMRKRAERYREKPKELDDLAGQMEGLEIEDKAATFNEVFEQMPVGVGKAISKRESLEGETTFAECLRDHPARVVQKIIVGLLPPPVPISQAICPRIQDETNQTGNSTLVYGEITFETLAFVLHKIKTRYGVPGVGHSGDNGVLQKPGGVFYDIGSGTGKPVIGAAILYPFRKSVGIEILEGLHAASMEVLKKWEAGRAKDEVGHKVPTNVRFIRGNALDFDTCNWSDADVVFANSTCFDDALMRNLATTASCLKKGSIFVTLTKRLPAADFKVLEHEMCPMSWGSATVYISQKTTEPFGDPNNPSGIADAGTE